MASTFMATLAPSFITAPLPNCFSIWASAVSSASFLLAALFFSGEANAAFFSAISSKLLVPAPAGLFCPAARFVLTSVLIIHDAPGLYNHQL